MRASLRMLYSECISSVWECVFVRERCTKKRKKKLTNVSFAFTHTNTLKKLTFFLFSSFFPLFFPFFLFFSSFFCAPFPEGKVPRWFFFFWEQVDVSGISWWMSWHLDCLSWEFVTSPRASIHSHRCLSNRAARCLYIMERNWMELFLQKSRLERNRDWRFFSSLRFKRIYR